MLSGPRDTVVSPAKRRRELRHRTRARKKHKRLDAIWDEPSASYLADRLLADNDGPVLRRSSRIRRAPDLFDSSPATSTPMNNVNNLDTAGDIGGKKKGKCTEKDKEVSGGSDVLEKGEPVSQMDFSLREECDWKSRLRTRAGKNRVKLSSTFTESHGGLRKSIPSLLHEKNIGVGTLSSRRRWIQEEISNHDATKTGNEDKMSPLIDKDYNNALLDERSSQVDVSRVTADDQLDSEQAKLLESLEKFAGFIEEAGFVNPSTSDGVTHHTVIEDITLPPCSQVAEEHGSEDHGSNQSSKHPESHVTIAMEREGILKDRIQETVHSLKGNHQRVSVSSEKIAGFRIKEGRRCGLCGCGSDGRPPKKLVHESFDSENEAYDGSTASEEPNYNIWDGFGGEPGWLGRLLGPMHDRFGIARVWVHQQCAVWSPEVYFANLGCLKNVRAALCRGRALKCSRCGRPGATIGCRVDRCPKTYHLPCSRIEGCIFDHCKFLIACSDHRRFFQPHGNNRTIRIRKMKAKKLRLDLRKVANEASRKDLESEEKWLENWGEDEEFLKREGRRLHRDILRIAPIYIGGSSESEHLYQGWDSLAGLEHVIQCMKEVVLLPLLYPEFLANLGLTPPRGVLLHGYPGTGKTHVVRALIGACSRGDKKIAYFARKGADCLGKYVGDAERQLRLLFQVAERSQPSIIFFDEIDGLAPRRSRQQDQTHSSVVSTLLSLLDGLKSRGSVIVIGATNRPDAVDPALRRPGRFDREIYFPLPSKKDRSSILSLHTRSWPKPLSGSLLSWIANTTVGYAGADLQALCAQAAIHALKRKCALQQLLSSAAKGAVQGKLPCLPSFKVEEKDWLAVLSLAPPPCSRREAGIAVNDIVASPLPAHLIPCFLLPLSQLLVSLYIDERIWLSPILFKASRSVKKILALALEQKGLPVDFWWSHLHYLIREPFIAAKIRSMFAHCGLIIGSLGSSYPVVLDQLDDVSIENENFDSSGINPSTVYMHKRLRRNYPLQVGKGIGFRTLISGARRSGQRHLASCLLQGFMGHEEIRMVSLATISLEGHGDMIYGLTQILLKCLDVGGCIIYMPRIDLWALDQNTGANAIERQDNPEKDLSMIERDTSRRKGVSVMWNSFVKQVESAVTSASLTILATCELEKGDLPHGLIRFFSTDVRSRVDSRPTECTVPRFFLHIDGKLDLELVINSAAEQLSYDLVQHYLKLINERIHNKDSGDVHKGPHVDINSEANKQNTHHALVTPQAQVQDAVASNGGGSCINDSKIEGTNVRPFPPRTKGEHVVPSQPYGVQDSFPRTGKVRKGNLSLAIATFGYQILRYPQFAELVWLTSKLKEGPCTDISGAWKHWPFNTCVMHTECSHEKRISGPNSCNVNVMVSAGVVRGLIAVGLLAYRGFYTTVSEVSTDVRKVLELLVGQIRAKLFGRKDRYSYLRVMSQVAYLDDMVNSWGYMLESLQADNNMAEVNSKSFVLGRFQLDNMNAGSIDITDNRPNIQVHVKSNNIAPEISPQGVAKSSNIAPEISHRGVAIDGEFVNTFKENGDYVSANFSAGIISCVQHIASKELTNGDLESSLSSQRLKSLDQIPGLTENNRCNHVSQLLVSEHIEKGTSKRCTSLDTVLCSNQMGSIPNEQLDDSTSYIFEENDSLSKASCLYNCCSNCVHMVNVMAHKMISSYLKLDGCYSVDDVHDIITSCSLNILASFKKFCISESSAKTHLEDGDDVFKRKPCHCKALMKIEFLPAECNCHTGVEDDTTSTGSDGGSLLETKLTHFFRDGVLVPSIPNKDSDLHCNFQKICLCSVVMLLEAIKHTLD